MLDGLVMLFFAFNPIICGLLLAAGVAIIFRPRSAQAAPLDLTSITALRRWRAGGELRQAGRR